MMGAVDIGQLPVVSFVDYILLYVSSSKQLKTDAYKVN
jgi:hypothetical protein